LDTPPKSYAPGLNQEIVKVHDEEAVYGSVTGPDAYWLLRWKTDGMYYEMYYYSMIGGTLDKEEMIAIAESMQDFNDFRTKDYPYEYVSLYARALGFDAKEFPVTPAGWSYTIVWPNPEWRCIVLVYTSTREQGTLYISQCLTDKRSDLSGIPASSIAQVQIGAQPGQYIAGEFVAKDNGDMVWDPVSPTKQLYWQEDGLWMQVSVYGGSALVYDKEKLISLAESLR
jgi:hypothetical protein